MASFGWKYRQDIDGLRALAVAIVILFHFEFSWLPGGFVGVDVFFVISGFLITSLIARQIAENRFSLVDFYERRFRRIYPNLLIVLAVTAILGFIAVVPLTYRPFGRSLIWATLSASNFSFIGGDGYFDPDNLTKPLLHTWSLGVEEQFYLVFPWLLILAARRGYSTRWLIGLIVALSLALSVGAAVFDWAPSYFLLPTRFWELGIGALIAILPPGDRLSSPGRSILGIAGLLAIGWAALRLTDAAPFPGYLALAPTLGTAAVIWADGGLAGRILSFRPFVWIGRLSFALYLWHWPLISIAVGIGLPPTNTGTRLVITAVMLALSLIGYFLWEQPIRQRRWLQNKKAFFAALAIFALTLIAVGVAIVLMKGVPQRLPADLAAMELATHRETFLISHRCASAESTNASPCPLGDETENKVSFVVLGDSHSAAVAAEIGDLAKRYRLRGLYLGRGGCPPLVHLTRVPSAACSTHLEAALATIRQYDPKLIIYIAQWSAILGDPNGGYKIELYRDGTPVPEPSRFQTIEASLDETLSALGNRSVVTAVTFPEYLGKVSLYWKLWAGRLGYAMLGPDLSLAEHNERQTYVRQLLTRATEKHKNLAVVDPTPIFCWTGACERVTEKAILYGDETHLSHAGALLYAPLFEPSLAKLAQNEAGAD